MAKASFKIILNRNSNDRALFRVHARAGVVANGHNTKIRDKICCVPCIDPSIDNRIILQKGESKKNTIDFSFYENFVRMCQMQLTFKFDLRVESGCEIPKYVRVLLKIIRLMINLMLLVYLVSWM